MQQQQQAPRVNRVVITVRAFSSIVAAGAVGRQAEAIGFRPAPCSMVQCPVSRSTSPSQEDTVLPDHLVAPHGGALVNLFAGDDRRAALRAESRDWPSHDLTPRQLCDLELLVSGGFSPLTGFLGRRDYDRVCAEMRLGGGTLWPVPITLDVTEAFASSLAADRVSHCATKRGSCWRPWRSRTSGGRIGRRKRRRFSARPTRSIRAWRTCFTERSRATSAAG